MISGKLSCMRIGLTAVAVFSSLLLATEALKTSYVGIGPQTWPTQFPSPWAYLLNQDSSDMCPPATPLVIDSLVYEGLTAEPLPQLHFELVGASMAGTLVEPWLAPVNVTTELIILADESANAFTLNDLEVAFEITFPNYGDIKFRYLNYDPKSKCFDIYLQRKWKSHWRMTVGETSDTRDLDTLNHLNTNKRLCTNKLTIRLMKQPYKRY